MAKIRIGNDIQVAWTLKDGEGNPYDLTGRDVDIFIVCYGIKYKADFTAAANVATFTFWGRDQQATGKYDLLLVENYGGQAQIKFDVQAVFELVPHSWMTNDESAEGIATESVQIVSTVSEGIVGPRGLTGNGIASAVLNPDYTLTLNFTDGTSYTTTSIRGAQGAKGNKGDKGDKGDTGAQGPKGDKGDTGNGIASAVLNADYTLTLTFTDGTSYTTPSIRGPQGPKGEKGDKGDGAVTPTLLVGNLTEEEKAMNVAVIEGMLGGKNSVAVAQTLDFTMNGAILAEYALHQIDKIDSNTYHLTVSTTTSAGGGYTTLYKLIIQGGVFSGSEYLSETVQARIIGVSSLNYGAEGEEHTVTGTIPSSIIPYADAPTVNTCNYYIAGYGLSYGYRKFNRCYECYFESGQRTMRLRVYPDGHVTTFWDSKMQDIAYADLKTMRDNARLKPGKKYRIYDYVTTTADTESRSLEHPFDIIVTALDEYNLSEEARAAAPFYNDDEYFADTNFAAWKIWYCLDNDTTRFAWADTTNGKGVIYRMIDEWGNDVPYDFKNIQFKRYKVTAKTAYTVNGQSIDLTASLGVCNGLYIGLSGTKSRGFDIDSSDYKWYFTFSRLGSTWDADIVDASLTGAGASNNTYGAVAYSGAVALNNIVNANGQVVTDFRLGINSNITSAYYYTDTVSVNCHFGENVSHISHFGSASNTFGQSQYRNNICVGVAQRHNTLGSDVENNSVIAIYDNAFNTLGSAFHSNVVAIFNSFASNTIDDEGNSNYFFSNAIASGMGWLYTNISTSFESNIIVASKFDQQTIGPLFRRNNISCTFSSNRIGPMFQDNTIAGTQFAYNTTKSSFYNNTTNGEITSLIANVSGHHNVFNGQIGHVIMDGQITYCTLNGPIKNSSFFGILQYITIAAGTSTSQFACCDIKGNIRGTSSVPITLDASQFRLASLSGVNRRITIEGQADGKITATWMEGGKRVGIYKTQGDATWTALPSMVEAAGSVTKIWAGTQAQYDALTPASDTLYLITPAQ